MTSKFSTTVRKAMDTLIRAGVTPTQYRGYIGASARSAEANRRLITALKNGYTFEQCARISGLKMREVTAQWRKLVLAGQVPPEKPARNNKTNRKKEQQHAD